MGHGLFKSYSMVMAAAGTTATVDLGQAFRAVYLMIPSMVSSANLDIYVKASANEGYLQLGKDIPNTTTVQSWSFTVAATATVNGRCVPIPGGFQYYKVVADSAPAAALNFKAVCAN